MQYASTDFEIQCLLNKQVPKLTKISKSRLLFTTDLTFPDESCGADFAALTVNQTSSAQHTLTQSDLEHKAKKKHPPNQQKLPPPWLMETLRLNPQKKGKFRSANIDLFLTLKTNLSLEIFVKISWICPPKLH